MWDNVDDGLDLFMFEDAVTIEEVYAWGNGFNRWGFDQFEGDGNGFKLGIEDGPAADHVVRNSIAFGNDLGGGLIGDPFEYFGLSGMLGEDTSAAYPVMAFVAFQAVFGLGMLFCIFAWVREDASPR